MLLSLKESVPSPAILENYFKSESRNILEFDGTVLIRKERQTISCFYFLQPIAFLQVFGDNPELHLRSVLQLVVQSAYNFHSS